MRPALRTDTLQEDFGAGMFPEGIDPTRVPANGAVSIVNALIDEGGQLYNRGPTAYKSTSGMGSAGLTWIWDGVMLPGQRTVFANSTKLGVLSAASAPIELPSGGTPGTDQSALLSNALFIGTKTIYGGSRKSANYTTGKVNVEHNKAKIVGVGTSFTANVDVGMLLKVGEATRVYVVEKVNSNTELTLSEIYEGTTLTEQTYTLKPVHSIAEAEPYPDTASAVAVCSNRLLAGIGNKVYFSEISNPHKYLNRLGTENVHTLPKGAEVIGISTIGETALIFTTQGIWTLDGLALDIVDQNGNPQHRLQNLAADIILAGAAGLANSGQQRIIVPALDGIYLMDGISSPTRISSSIDSYYSRLVSSFQATLGRAVLYKGHYFLPVRASNSVTNSSRVTLVGKLKGAKGVAWTHLTGDGGETAAYAVRYDLTSEEDPFALLGAQSSSPSRVVRATFLSSGRNKDANNTNYDTEVVLRDMATGSGNRNQIRSLRARYELSSYSGSEPKLLVEVDTLPGTSWEQVGEKGPISDGRESVKFRLKGQYRRVRNARFRLKTSLEFGAFHLRSAEMNVRPSGARR